MPPTLPAVIVKSLKYLVSVLFYKFVTDSVVKNSNIVLIEMIMISWSVGVKSVSPVRSRPTQVQASYTQNAGVSTCFVLYVFIK